MSTNFVIVFLFKDKRKVASVKADSEFEARQIFENSIAPSDIAQTKYLYSYPWVNPQTPNNGNNIIIGST